MKTINLRELSPEERQAWVGRMLMAEELGQVFDYDIPPMPTPKTKPKHSVEVHESRKKCTFCEVLTWSYVVGAVLAVIIWVFFT